MLEVALYFEEKYQDDRLILDEGDVWSTALTALSFFDEIPYELSIICVDETESQTLNRTYRGKDKPTNVLSFGSDLPDEILAELPALPLGDLIICVPVVLAESAEQDKTPIAHFTHLVVHGILHLLGYDHELGEEQAEEMESLEIDILAKLNIDNPYKDDFKDSQC